MHDFKRPGGGGPARAAPHGATARTYHALFGMCHLPDFCCMRDRFLHQRGCGSVLLSGRAL
eukprot:10764141-Prorocentrum_lima.AAC.1